MCHWTPLRTRLGSPQRSPRSSGCHLRCCPAHQRLSLRCTAPKARDRLDWSCLQSQRWSNLLPCRSCSGAPDHPRWKFRWTQRKSSLSRRQNCLGAPNQWVEHHCSLRARSARRSFRLSRTWDCHRKDWLRKHRGAARRWSIPSRSKNPARVRRASPSVRATRRLFLWTDASSDIVPTAWLPPLLDLSEKGQHPPIEGLGYRRPYDFVK